jgi:asparagine synthase (glutamine-hydrolysing)
MCGIAGFVDGTKDLGVLQQMTDAIARRGPDDHGYYHENGVGLGHRRLSIIDLSPLGHQPMRFESLLIVFNGEIYN